MAEDVTKKSIQVTAEQWAHPAVRKIARACIAFARQLIASAKEIQPKEGESTSGEEQADD